MATIWQDLRFAARLLFKTPWITLAAVAALALGIGATNAAFTVVNAVMFRNLPFERPDRIVWLATQDARGRELGVSMPDFDDWRRLSRSFVDIGMGNAGDMNLIDDNGASKAENGSYITAEAFAKILRVQPILGRTLTAEDGVLGAPGVAILAASLWKSRYGGDPSVLGRAITLNAVKATIVGVMPEHVRFPLNAEVWIATSQYSAALRALGRPARGYHAYGRLADGVSIEQARAELSSIGAALARQYPATNKDMVPTVAPYAERLIGPQVRLMSWSLLGAVALVLLIACANVANLLLARASHRSREVAVRVALGATRPRIVRQLLAESLLLAIVSGVVGLIFSILCVRWFDTATQDLSRPSWVSFTMDGRVFVLLLLVCLATAITFGLAPALHTSRANINELLKQVGRLGGTSRHTRLWASALIVAELSLSLVVLAGAGFMTRSFLRLYQADVPFDRSQLATMYLRMITRKYPTPESRWTFLQRVEERLDSVGEITAVSTTSHLPMAGGCPFSCRLMAALPKSVQALRL